MTRSPRQHFRGRTADGGWCTSGRRIVVSCIRRDSYYWPLGVIETGCDGGGGGGLEVDRGIEVASCRNGGAAAGASAYRHQKHHRTIDERQRYNHESERAGLLTPSLADVSLVLPSLPARTSPATPRRSINDRDDPHDHDKYTTSLRHRQEQASAYYRTHLRDYSRPSSSSGSAASTAPSLRRTARFEARPSRLRSSSADSPSHTRLAEADNESREPRQQTSHRRTASAHYPYASYKHPALRVSSRTHNAITYALEEGLRKGPKLFTADEVEESAEMSDLGGVRASNGGARTTGPVPVSAAGARAGMRTPTQVMRDRTAREAQRQEEQKAEEQRRLAEERRRSAERRAAAVGGGAPRFSQTSSHYSPDVSAPQSGFDQRRSTGAQVAPSDALGNPTSRTSQVYPDSRTRGPSVTQQDQPRPATTGGARRTQPAARQTTSAPGASAGPSQQPQADSGAQQRTGPSSFPHAFERWETLSSHWEGLTSYWLRKLEQNTEEIHNIVPNAVTLNRQITDLSAAGANLFHAVVELQRLRASSERKFQRWFFEAKREEEKQKESHAELRQVLEQERKSREDVTRRGADSSIQIENARREAAEAKRELAISKEEARRAWEELGRRNQESLETAQSLKDGRITVVHGVQVVPYFGGPSRTGSASQRPQTRDGPQYGNTGMASGPAAAGLTSPGDEREYYQQDASPTNTDPFTEQKPLHHEPGQQSFNAGTYYPTGGSPSQRPPPASAGSLTPSARAPAGGMTDQEAQRFYQHPPGETFLHSAQSSSHGAPPQAREDIRSQGSYVDTLSEGDTEYALDAAGNVRVDERGRPIVYGSQPQRHESNETDDSYDVQADIRREAEHAARYGGSGGGGAGLGGAGIVPPEAPTAPSTSAQAMAHFSPTSGQGQQSRPTYEGEEYEDWEPVRETRHHHPTRLSDVLEEEEERSSRRTGD
ncbi:uncharacterized protein LTR77_010030 [Saxophila tyrrhenica]|uniref:Uncharacterized protein n=1 Tax=Saxophila tyrrhenica TaxID=1690608 RepID=A0AAV9NWS0_9PEZI|nr:hypothetical protein LTR77_010030 [Saxophila tyrrhenica]